MKKLLVIGALIILVATLGYVWYQGNAESEGNTNPGVARGVIMDIDREEVTFDGPTYIMIRSDSGDRATIAVPSMGINLCAAVENIADVSELREDMAVEVRGDVGEEGYIVPCASEDHYLRVLQ